MSHAAALTLRRYSVTVREELITQQQLTQWLNGLLNANYSFEELTTGEAYCRLLCKLKPKSLELSKVRRGAKREADYLKNFKLLQQGLQKAGLRRHFNIDDLISGRFRQHYELLKWFKRLFDETRADREADATGGARAAEAPEQGQAAAERGDYRRQTRGTRPRTLPGPQPAPAPLAQPPHAERCPSPELKDEIEKLKDELTERKDEIEELKDEVDDLIQHIKVVSDELEKLRSVLRNITNMCRGRQSENAEEVGVVEKIMELLLPLELHGPPAGERADEDRLTCC